MEGSVFDASVSITRMKDNKSYRENAVANVIVTVCALLNTAGGKLTIKFEDISASQELRDILRAIEQRLEETFGSCIFFYAITTQTTNEQVDFFVIAPKSELFTVNYELYLPTETQVIPISPFERVEKVKGILKAGKNQKQPLTISGNFILDQNYALVFVESSRVQVKLLKAETSKCVSFADRMVNKTNKVGRYISAFGNKDGGRIFYGINDDGIVKGELLESKDKEEIIRKVTKTINNMTWPGGRLERGRQWDIQFEPVQDEFMNRIPSLFVVIVSVAAVHGGVFIKEPESYHILNGKVQKMSFTDWYNRLFNDKQPCEIMNAVPMNISRCQWSSVRAQKIYHKVSEKLVQHKNNGENKQFQCFANLAENSYSAHNVSLVILLERIACACKSCHFNKAKKLVSDFELRLSSFCSKDINIFQLRSTFIRSAICRAEGNYKESYKIAEEGLQLAEIVPAGVTLAWFYNHVATIETILSLSAKSDQERTKLRNSAHNHYTTALQHTQACSVEQEFPNLIGDSQQRIYVFLAIMYLGSFSNGVDLKPYEVTSLDITNAWENLQNFSRVVLCGHPKTIFRKIQFLFAKSDLHLCQWQQEKEKSLKSESNETPLLLKAAFDDSKEALELARKFHFDEMVIYARKRMAVLTELILQVKVSTISLSRKQKEYSIGF